MSMKTRLMLLVLTCALLLPIAYAASLTAQAEPLAALNIDEEIYDLDWHPQHHVLAVASETGISLFSHELELVAQLPADDFPFTAVSWHPDGSQLAIGTAAERRGAVHAQIQFWNYNHSTTSLAFAQSLDDLGEYTIGVAAVKWSPNGELLATYTILDPLELGALDPLGSLFIWNTTSWETTTAEPLFGLVTPTSANLNWSPDSTQIVLGTSAIRNPGFVRTLNAQTLQPVWSTEFNFGPFAATWSNNNLIAVQADYLWIADANTGIDILQLSSSAHPQWSPDGSALFVSLPDETALESYGIIDIATGTILRSFTLPFTGWRVDWHSSGDYIAGVDPGGPIFILDSSNLPPAPADVPTLTPLPTVPPTPTFAPRP